MSIPEAPFDGEAHARKEGAWVLAYGRTALDSFVELCRSFFDGCRYYHDETKKTLRCYCRLVIELRERRGR